MLNEALCVLLQIYCVRNLIQCNLIGGHIKLNTGIIVERFYQDDDIVQCTNTNIIKLNIGIIVERLYQDDDILQDKNITKPNISIIQTQAQHTIQLTRMMIWYTHYLT